ncbi:MAG TPA: protein kinase, partial [Polyangiaceae bacterium]|nr:protein kinase [Polyangiaceae bacterium]
MGSAPPQVDVLLGSCIDDRYELVELIGRGARSLVYRADDLQLNRSVTLKLIPDGRCTADRLERVSRATASSCPNLVAVFDAGDAAEGAYVVMETLVGTTLTHVLEHEGVSTQMVLRIMAAAADGITAAHRAGLVHSNLVASNVFLTADHAVKVLDVGACSVDFCGPSAPGLLEPFDAEPSTFEELGVIAPVPAHTAPARRNVQSLVRLLEALLFGPRSHEGTGLAAVPPELQRGAFATSFEHVTSAAELAFELARLADAIDERASIASDAPSRPRVSVR